MLRDYRAQLQDIRDSAAEVAVAPAVADNELTGAENVDPGSNGRSGRQWPHGVRSGKNGGRSSGSGGDGSTASRSNNANSSGDKGGVLIGDVDTLEGQRQFLEALVQETEKVCLHVISLAGRCFFVVSFFVFSCVYFMRVSAVGVLYDSACGLDLVLDWCSDLVFVLDLAMPRRQWTRRRKSWRCSAGSSMTCVDDSAWGIASRCCAQYRRSETHGSDTKRSR